MLCRLEQLRMTQSKDFNESKERNAYEEDTALDNMGIKIEKLIDKEEKEEKSDQSKEEINKPGDKAKGEISQVQKLTTKENQTSVPITKENQTTLPVTKENQTITKENQSSAPVTKENQTITKENQATTKENQTSLSVTKENQTTLSKDFETAHPSSFNTASTSHSKQETRIPSNEQYQTEKLDLPKDQEESTLPKFIIITLLGAATLIGALYFFRRIK